MKSNQYEVVIVGGGPAGIATGLTLNALGISNCIVEAAATPRHKYGEALPPNARPILRQLGIESLVEDDHHIKYYGNKSCWGSEKLEQKEFISDLHGHGYLLDRNHFENQLWARYVSIKGDLFNGCRLSSIREVENDLLLVIDDKTQKTSIRTKIVVDATGRKSSVCRHLGVPKIELDAQFALTMAVSSKKAIEHQIIVEATQNGWWYAAPNGQNEIILMFFTLKDLIPLKEKIASFLQSEFESSIHVSQLSGSNIFSESTIGIMSAGTSRLQRPYGDNWIAVGDAAFAYDPISSYGITSALASGYYAAQGISSKLSGKEEAMDAYQYIVEYAFRAYTEKLFTHYSLENRWPESTYWKDRFS